MTPGSDTRRFRRLLMALDPTSGDLAALDGVAALAARFEAELLGLFVEDQDLAHLAEHPGVKVWGPVSRTQSVLDPSVLRRALTVQAKAGRQAFDLAAQRAKVPSRFEVRQGRVSVEVKTLAREADLTVVGWSSGGFSMRPVGHPSRPGHNAAKLARESEGSILLLRDAAAFSGPVMTAWDGSDAARLALEVAGLLARHDAASLETVLLTHRKAETEAWSREVAAIASAFEPKLHVLPVGDRTVDALCRAAHHCKAGLLVLGGGQSVIAGEELDRLLARIDCSVLLVR